MQDLQGLACLPIEHVDCTVIAAAHYNFRVFSKGNLLRDDFDGVASREGSDVGSVIELM